MADKNQTGIYESISDQTLSWMKSFVSSGIFFIAIIIMPGLEVSHITETVLSAITVVLAEVYCFTFVATMARAHWSMADLLNCGSTLLAIIVTALVWLKHVARVPSFDYPVLTMLLATGMFMLALVEKVLRGIKGAPAANIAVKSG